jgi:hypothetical protein
MPSYPHKATPLYGRTRRLKHRTLSSKSQERPKLLSVTNSFRYQSIRRSSGSSERYVAAFRRPSCLSHLNLCRTGPRPYQVAARLSACPTLFLFGARSLLQTTRLPAPASLPLTSPNQPGSSNLPTYPQVPKAVGKEVKERRNNERKRAPTKANLVSVLGYLNGSFILCVLILGVILVICGGLVPAAAPNTSAKAWALLAVRLPSTCTAKQHPGNSQPPTCCLFTARKPPIQKLKPNKKTKTRQHMLTTTGLRSCRRACPSGARPFAELQQQPSQLSYLCKPDGSSFDSRTVERTCCLL